LSVVVLAPRVRSPTPPPGSEVILWGLLAGCRVVVLAPRLINPQSTSMLARVGFDWRTTTASSRLSRRMVSSRDRSLHARGSTVRVRQRACGFAGSRRIADVPLNVQLSRDSATSGSTTSYVTMLAPEATVGPLAEWEKVYGPTYRVRLGFEFDGEADTFERSFEIPEPPDADVVDSWK